MSGKKGEFSGSGNTPTTASTRTGGNRPYTQKDLQIIENLTTDYLGRTK